MSAKPQLELVDNAMQPLGARPDERELVTKQVLYLAGLNAQAFSGELNPSTIYRTLVDGSVSAFPYYRELVEKDTAIAAALETRKALVLSREAQVHAAAEEGRAREIADALAAFLDRIPGLRFALWEMLDSRPFGYAVTEILWTVGAAGVGVRRLVGRPQELFRFGKSSEPQIGELLLSSFPGGEGAPVPPAKFIVTTFRARQGDRRGLPLLRQLFWPSWFKRNALRLMLKYLEKGDGTVVVKYQDPKDKDEALKAALAIAREIASAVPEGFSLLEGSGLTTQRARTGSDFKDMFQFFDAEIRRIILGQTQTTQAGEGGTGTQALGRVHEETQDDIIRNDALDLEWVINEQLCAPWLRWTFGDAALERDLRPWWTIDKDPPEDREEELRVIEKARSLGIEISKEYARMKAQIPALEAGEEALPPPAISAAMLGGILPEGE
jgi:phage gp29-like protein